jgi:hypothetical protein
MHSNLQSYPNMSAATILNAFKIKVITLSMFLHECKKNKNKYNG